MDTWRRRWPAAPDDVGGAPGRGVVRGWARSSAQRCAASRSIPRNDAGRAMSIARRA
jgi:hypothetical protein